jgi:ligand-binding SRPBCC domain-containing protein
MVSMHQLDVTQAVPLSLDEAWAFFSDPRNLAVITPPDMGFVIHSAVPPVMYEGLLIEYTVRPLLNLPVRWVTEIVHVKEREYFVDEQRSGPYRMWHHEHHFRPVPGGVEVRDLVSYMLPLGPLGDIVNRVAVRQRLEEIFRYRRRVLVERFGPMPAVSLEAAG